MVDNMNTYEIEVEAISVRNMKYEMDSDNFVAVGVPTLKELINLAYENGYKVVRVVRRDPNATYTDVTSRYVKRAKIIVMGKEEAIVECGATVDELIPMIKTLIKQYDCGLIVQMLYGYKKEGTIAGAMHTSGFFLRSSEEHACGRVEFYSMKTSRYISHSVAVWY